MALTDSPTAARSVAPAVEAATVSRPGMAPAASTEPIAAERVLGAIDHVTIGRVVVGLSLLFTVLAGIAVALVQIDTALLEDGIPGTGLLGESLALRLGTNAPIALFLCGVLPLLVGLAILVVPAQVGSPTVSFPKATAFLGWTWAGASVLYLVAILADGGYGGADLDMARLGNVAVGGLLLTLAALGVCVAVTVLTLRPDGMALADVPFFAFSMLVAASLAVLTLPVAFARLMLVQISRPTVSDLSITGVDALSWLFRQPSVYLVAIPVLGIALDAVAVATGARQRSRGVLQGAIGALGLLSFGAWAQQDVARETLVWFGLALAAGLPVLVVVGGVADTLRSRRPSFIAPLGLAVAALLTVLLAVLAGLLQALDLIGDEPLVGFGTEALAGAQFHFVLGAGIAAGLAGVVLWGRHAFGTALPEGPAKLTVPLALGGAVLFGIGPLVLGLLIANDGGIDRRAFAAVAAIGVALLVIAADALLTFGLRARWHARGTDAVAADPWGTGGTLEWAEAGAVPTSVTSPYPLLPDTEEVPG